MRSEPDHLYERDFFAWTQQQAKELRRFARTRPNLLLDFPHIADEIADLGTSQRDSLRSWARRIIEHLLLLEHSRARKPRRGRVEEALNFRSEIDDRLSATLRRDLRRQLPRLYARARRDVEKKLALYDEGERSADPQSTAPTGWIRSSVTFGPMRRPMRRMTAIPRPELIHWRCPRLLRSTTSPPTPSNWRGIARRIAMRHDRRRLLRSASG